MLSVRMGRQLAAQPECGVTQARYVLMVRRLACVLPKIIRDLRPIRVSLRGQKRIPAQASSNLHNSVQASSAREVRFWSRPPAAAFDGAKCNRSQNNCLGRRFGQKSAEDAVNVIMEVRKTLRGAGWGYMLCCKARDRKVDRWCRCWPPDAVRAVVAAETGRNPRSRK